MNPRYVNLCDEPLPHAKYGVDLAKVPDTYIEPFTAYRAWNWTSEGITSLNQALWKPKVPFEATTAQCGEDHPVPSPDCTCGMYAGINMQHLIDIRYIERGIHGEVSLWGRLYRHTLGWRAQFAYPKYFVVPHDMIPLRLEEGRKRLDILAEFEVPIYLQTTEIAEVGQTTLPLWMPDFGYSQQGLSWLVNQRADWYEKHRKEPKVLKKGDRIMVFPAMGSVSGIGVVDRIEGTEVYYTMFSLDMIYHKAVGEVEWCERSWQWETYGCGASRRIGRR